MAKEANKTTVIALLVVAGILLFLVGSYTGNAFMFGRRIGGTTTTGLTSCKWIDRYFTGMNDYGSTPLNQVCSKYLGNNYKPIAYEARRDIWIYSSPTCEETSLTGMTYDHQLIESYGGGPATLGGMVGNLDKCHHVGDTETGAETGGFYEKQFQEYDGVLCCK